QRRLWQLDRRDDAIKVQGLLTRWHEDQVLISEATLLANRLMQQARQGARICEKSGQGLVEDALAAGREQGFRRRVDVPYKKGARRAYLKRPRSPRSCSMFFVCWLTASWYGFNRSSTRA